MSVAVYTSDRTKILTISDNVNVKPPTPFPLKMMTDIYFHNGAFRDQLTMSMPVGHLYAESKDSNRVYEPRKRNCMSSGLKVSIALSSALTVEWIMLVFFS